MQTYETAYPFPYGLLASAWPHQHCCPSATVDNAMGAKILASLTPVLAVSDGMPINNLIS